MSSNENNDAGMETDNDTRDQLHREIINNILELLRDKRGQEEGYNIGDLGRAYFAKYGKFFYPEVEGFQRGWNEVLARQEIVPHAQFYNNGICVRWKDHDGSMDNSQPNQSTSNQNPPVDAFFKAKKEPFEKPLPPGGLRRTHEQIDGANNNDQSAKRMTTTTVPPSFVTDSDSEASSETGSDVSQYVISHPNEMKLANERRRIAWIPREHKLVPLTYSNLVIKREIAPEKPEMFIDCTYCDRHVLEDLMNVKQLIKGVNSHKFSESRNNLNGFEFGRFSIFNNGAAIKMANIDALLGGILINPKAQNGTSLIGPNELLYFVDMYGGPGGSAEYFLWRKKWQCKGFGISPRGKNTDYDLQQAEHYPRESFEAYYGESGSDGNGDLSKPFNLSKFCEFVRDSTETKGVHFAIGNAGDRSDYVDEDQKEIRCKYIIMAEFLVALKVLRQDGHFVCRMYDIFTPFTVGLVYLMHRTFHNVAIIKPETVLPASSERYIVCKWKRSEHHTKEVINYIGECHKLDWLTNRNKRNQTEIADIIHLVSRDLIKDSPSFCNYILNSNNEFGRRQDAETRMLVNAIQRKQDIKDAQRRQTDILEKAWTMWGVPRKTRQRPKYAKASTPEIRAFKLAVPYNLKFYDMCEETLLTNKALKDDIKDTKEWTFMLVGQNRGFYMSLGGAQVYRYINGAWKEVRERVELMNNTMVYADLIEELKVNGSHVVSIASLQIIDAMILGGFDIRDRPQNERYDLTVKYAKSMNKNSREDFSTVRAKPLYEMKYFSLVMKSVQESDRVRPHDGVPLSYTCPVNVHKDQGLIFSPNGVIFMKHTKEGFAPADFLFCINNRLIWPWHEDVNIKVTEPKTEPETLELEIIESPKKLPSANSIITHLEICGV